MHTSISPGPVVADLQLSADPARPAFSVPANEQARKRINSKTLLGSEREIEIDHGGQLYRLRITALGKLILTK